MPRTEELRKMQDYLCSVLDRTGEFSEIEPEYRFPSEEPGSPLRQRTKKQIYCVKKPEFSRFGEEERFLVLTHPDEKIPGELLANKIIEASEKGVHLTNVLYRYINSVSDRNTQGPLFRRFIRDEERKSGPVAYRKRAPFNNPLLGHYSNEEINRFRILRDIERIWVNAASNFLPAYYQPNSARLEEMLKLYRFKRVRAEGVDKKGNYHSENYQTVFDPDLIESSRLFSLEPMRRRATRSSIVGSLENRTQSRNPVRFPRDCRILLADFLPLPEAHTEKGEEVLRHNIALLGYARQFGLSDLSAEMLERTGRETEDLDSSHSLVQVLEGMLEGGPDIVDELRSKESRTIKVRSNSTPGLYHHVLITQDLDSSETEYVCSCKGYRFSSRDNKHCRHTDELRKIDEFSTSD